jgi:hypothetical protein
VLQHPSLRGGEDLPAAQGPVRTRQPRAGGAHVASQEDQDVQGDQGGEDRAPESAARRVTAPWGVAAGALPEHHQGPQEQQGGPQMQDHEPRRETPEHRGAAQQSLHHHQAQGGPRRALEACLRPAQPVGPDHRGHHQEPHRGSHQPVAPLQQHQGLWGRDPPAVAQGPVRAGVPGAGGPDHATQNHQGQGQDHEPGEITTEAVHRVQVARRAAFPQTTGRARPRLLYDTAYPATRGGLPWSARNPGPVTRDAMPSA